MSQRELIESILPDRPTLTRDELAEVLSTPVQTLAAMACKKTGPSYIKLGRAVRYPRPSVVAWLMSNANVIPTQL